MGLRVDRIGFLNFLTSTIASTSNGGVAVSFRSSRGVRYCPYCWLFGSLTLASSADICVVEREGKLVISASPCRLLCRSWVCNAEPCGNAGIAESAAERVAAFHGIKSNSRGKKNEAKTGNLILHLLLRHGQRMCTSRGQKQFACVSIDHTAAAMFQNCSSFSFLFVFFYLLFSSFSYRKRDGPRYGALWLSRRQPIRWCRVRPSHQTPHQHGDHPVH